MEKKVYAMVKALKAFKTYVLHSKVIAYVPTSVVKDILVQADSDGKRGRWLAKIQEFDLEVKPTKLVKGQGLAKPCPFTNFFGFISKSNSWILASHRPLLPSLSD